MGLPAGVTIAAPPGLVATVAVGDGIVIRAPAAAPIRLPARVSVLLRRDRAGNLLAEHRDGTQVWVGLRAQEPR